MANRAAAALAAACAIAASAAEAQAGPDQAQVFHIPAQPRSAALLTLALQARISLGGEIDACSGPVSAISGRLTLAQALDQLLAGSDCAYVFVGPQTVAIRVRRRAIPAIESRPLVVAAAPATVGELVVTGARRPDLPSRLPMAITVRAGPELDVGRTHDLEAAADQIPGLSLTNLGPGRNKLLLRGLSDGVHTGVTQATVGLYLDDVPVTYNAPDPDLRFADLQQVEVLRGPQGTLYGAGSIGGIVRLVTRRPELDRWDAALMVSASNTQDGADNGSFEVVANAPLLAGRLAVRGVGYDELNSGYIDDTGLGLRRVNRTRRTGGRLAVRWAASPAMTMDAGIIHQSINTRDTQYVSGGGDVFERRTRLQEPHDNDFDEAYLTIQGDLPGAHWVASSAWLRHQIDTRYDATDALPAFGRLAADRAAFDDGRDIELFVHEATIRSVDLGRWRWLLGVFATQGDTTTADVLSRISPATALYSEIRTDKLSEAAVFGELGYAPTDRLELSAGLRWFRVDTAVQSRVIQPAGVRDFDGDRHDVGAAPSIELAWRRSANFNLYGRIAEGYRAGGFNTAGLIGETFDTPAHHRRYDPDKLWSYEIGTNLVLLDQTLRLRVAAFRAEWHGVQSDQFQDSGLSEAINVGNGSNQGLEAEATWRPNTAWQVRAAALVNDPQLTRIRPGVVARADTGLPGAPDLTLGLGVGYRRPLGSSLSLALDAQLAYVGRSFATFDASARMGGYVNGRLSAGVSNSRWDATAFIENPLDSRANTFAFGNPFHASADPVTPLRPRTIGVELRVRTP